MQFPHHSLCFLVPSSSMAKSRESEGGEQVIREAKLKGNLIVDSARPTTWCFTSKSALSFKAGTQSRPCICHNKTFCCIMDSAERPKAHKLLSAKPESRHQHQS